MVTAALAAPGSGKSTVAPILAELLPGHAVLDWDAFMAPAAALAGREIRTHPDTWAAYRELVRTAIATLAHVPVVLLTVCTPDELYGWPIDHWVLLDCADDERALRLGPHGGAERLEDAIRDGREYRSLDLAVIDTTGLTPKRVALKLAQFVEQVEQSASS